MNIPLNEFEQYIDEDILKRGLLYFKKGIVTHVDELGGGEYEAVVEGSETYEVSLTVQNGVVTQYECTCPYDWGPVCKHEVAVLFYLQQEVLGIKAKSKSKNQMKASLKDKKPAAKKKTIQEQLNEILDILPHNELKGFVGECCDKNRSFRDAFLTRYLHLIQPVTKDIYSKQIQSLVRSEAGRHGFLDYQAARRVGREVHELAQLAEREITLGHFREALYMSCAILEEMTKAINHGDDSNGDLGDGIRTALDLLFSLAENTTDKSVRRELYEYGLMCYQKEIFKGWDWHYHVLELAIELVETPEDKNTLLKLLDQLKPTGNSWDYDFEKAQSMRLELIRKTEGEESVNNYLEANITNHEFRKELIEKAIATKNYPKAIELCETGIKLNEKDKPGLATRWRTFLLDIYQLQKDIPRVIEMARFLFIDGGNTYLEKLFHLLKQQVAADDWNNFFELLVEDKKKTGRWISFTAIADMYIWEKRWENLLSWLIQDISLDRISYVEKYLTADYANQLVGLYYNGVEKYMEQNVGRDHYRVVCNYIRRMIKLGGRDEVDFLVAELRKRYPARKALLEELDKV